MAAAREAREELETRADEWRYLNEGGLNVVFGHRKREASARAREGERERGPPRLRVGADSARRAATCCA
jgi:hypothetical protein